MTIQATGNTTSTAAMGGGFSISNLVAQAADSFLSGNTSNDSYLQALLSQLEPIQQAQVGKYSRDDQVKVAMQVAQAVRQNQQGQTQTNRVVAQNSTTLNNTALVFGAATFAISMFQSSQTGFKQLPNIQPMQIGALLQLVGVNPDGKTNTQAPGTFRATPGFVPQGSRATAIRG